MPVVALSAIALGDDAAAATRVIPADTSTYNCESVGCQPGDVLVIVGSGSTNTRGPLTISNAIGSTTSPITVRNDTSASRAVTISRTSGEGGFIFTIDDSRNVVVDGTRGWSGSRGTCSGLLAWPTIGTPGTCGIKVVQSGTSTASAVVKVQGTSTFITIKGVEADGGGTVAGSQGAGIGQNDHTVDDPNYPYSSMSDVGVWREQMYYTNNYVHDTTGGECFYIGPNYSTTANAGGPDNAADGWKLRDVYISYNRVENCGSDGIKLKSGWGDADGMVVHHNWVERIGIAQRPTTEGATDHCIIIFEGNGTVHSNFCRDNMASVNDRTMISCAVQNLSAALPPGFVTCNVYNNVVHRSSGAGIAFSMNDGDAEIHGAIYNNTVVETGGPAITVAGGVTTCVVRDNLTPGESISPGACTNRNNRTGGTVAALSFLDAAASNFRLQESSPARDAGTSDCPEADFDGTVRRDYGACDQGALEYTGDVASARPNPPNLVQVR